MLSGAIAILLLIGLFIFLMAMRVPIAPSIGIASMVICIYLDIPVQMVFQNMVEGANTHSLLIVPFFILMSDIMSVGGISRRLLRPAGIMVGWMHGGLAMVTIVAFLLLGAAPGSSATSAATLGPTLILNIEKEGYEKDLATCIAMANLVGGILIPPSQDMAVHALTTGSVSVGTLFPAGILPDYLLTGCLMVYSHCMVGKRNYPIGEKFQIKRVWLALKDAFWGLLAIVIVVIGVYTGSITAAESTALAMLWSIFATFTIHRKVSIRELPRMLSGSIKTLAMIMILIPMSAIFGQLMACLKAPVLIANDIYGIIDNSIIVMLIINVLLPGLGMIIGVGPLIPIATPTLLPIIQPTGYSPVHSGVTVILNLGTGFLTLPVENSLFTAPDISGIKIEMLTRRILPIYLATIIYPMMATFVPVISTALPNLGAQGE